MQQVNDVISKEACPQCQDEGTDTSCDNLVTFSSGVQHCHRHGTVGKTSAVREQRTDEVTLSRPDLITGEYPRQPMRGISPKTFEYYGYQINKDKGCHIANYFNDAGQVVMQQLRDKEKNFPLLGDNSNKGMLYGSWLFTPDPRVFITITEGQLDCLSVAEAFDRKYPVVSLPNGASAAASVLQANLKYLNGFKYIALAFDNDKPGQDAINACLKLFEPGKLRIVKWRLKDANDLLKEKGHAEIRNSVYNAVEYLPAPILTGDRLLETLENYEQKTREWPWAAARKVIAPIYIPSIYTIAALPSVGKTVVMADIMRSVIKDGGKIGVISLEESTPKLLLKLADMVLGLKLRNIHNRQLTKDEIESVREVTKSIVTYNHREYGSDLDTIVDNLPYIAQALECEFIIFDNLSFSATGLADDERRGLDKAMLKLKDSSTRYGYTLFNITHLNDGEADFRNATIRGSRGMMMYSDQVIYLGRDVESEDLKERNTLTFYVKKDRESGMDTGKSFQLQYDPVKRRFIDENIW